VTEYRGANHLLLDRVLLSKSEPAPDKVEAKASAASRPTATAGDVPSAAAVLNVLSQDRQAKPLTGRTVPVAEPESRQPRDVGDARVLPDGSVIVDRVGRLVRDAEGWLFVFESGGGSSTHAPVRVLPSRLLATMEAASVGGTKHTSFVISGEVVTYRRRSYLFVRKVLARRSLGNLR